MAAWWRVGLGVTLGFALTACGAANGATRPTASAPSTTDLTAYGSVTTVTGAHATVLGVGTSRSRLAPYATLADRAVTAVTRVWGSAGWSGAVVVEVPATEAQFAALLSVSAASYRDVAAVTTGEIGRPASDRVYVNPDAFASLSAAGRQVVMTHEVTHVATRAWTTTKTPAWLAEGAADYTGYLDSGIPVAGIVSELHAELAGGTRITALPSDADFAGTDPAAAYELAWLACRLVAQTYGQPRLVALYHAVGTRSGGPAAQFPAVLGVSYAAFTTAWRAYVQRVAG
jgi:hypothetical protein